MPLRQTGRTSGTSTGTSTSLAQVSSTDRISRTVVLDQPIAQPWVEAVAHSMDLATAAPHGPIASAALPALVAVDSVAADPAVVAVDSVAEVDGVRAATQWRMK